MGSNHLAETIERLRAISSLDRGIFGKKKWFDILSIKPSHYNAFVQGQKTLPEASLMSLANFLKVKPHELRTGTLDFRALAVRYGTGERILPEKYSIAAFGKRRTTITSFDYLEKRFGWRLRMDVLRAFRMNESILSDFTASINQQFITDVSNYLGTWHKLKASDFYLMGLDAVHGNKDTMIGHILSYAKTTAEAYQILLEDLMLFFEKNTKYSFLKLTEDYCIIEGTSYPYIAEAIGVENLGNAHICHLKRGFFASIPMYLQLEPAEVIETHCVHRGDATCKYEVYFPRALPRFLRTPAHLNNGHFHS
jgi:hypothetical protein